MEANDRDQEIRDIVKYLQTPESYKKNIKPFRQSCVKGNEEKMEIVVAAVSQVVSDSDKEVPMSQLNAVRLIKETLDKKNEKMRELVQENILPILSKVAEFQKHNKSDDRGKTFFSDSPSQDLQIIGNSFFRLVLECLLVWGLWFEDSEYGSQLQNLLNQGVKFPETLNYFKDVNLKTLSQTSTLNSSQFGLMKSQNPEPQDKEKENHNNQQQNNNNTKEPQQIKNFSHISEQEKHLDDLQPVAKPQQNQQKQQQQQQQQDSSDIKVKSFKDITQRDDVDKYKISLKTGSDFRQLSPTNSYYSLTSTSRKAPISQNSGVNKVFYASQQNFGSSKSLLKNNNNGTASQAPSSKRGSHYNNNSGGAFNSGRKYNLGVTDFTINDNMDYGNEIKKLHNQIDELTQDRDHYKYLYEQDMHQLQILKKQHEKLKEDYTNLEKENMSLLQQSASRNYL